VGGQLIFVMSDKLFAGLIAVFIQEGKKILFAVTGL
jgi:hypothetical protein